MALTSDQITAQNFADFYQMILPYLNGGGFQMKKLWENTDPTQTFAAQDVALSSSDYDLLQIEYIQNTNNGTHKSIIISKGCDAHLDSSAGYCLYRTMTYTDATHYAVANGKVTTTYGSQDTNNNNVCIPYVIYGIKLYAYDNISCVMMSSTWEAGETTVEFTDPIIDGDSIFDVYLPSQYADLIYSSLSVSGHTLTITFPSAQASDIEVKLRVNRG